MPAADLPALEQRLEVCLLELERLYETRTLMLIPCKLTGIHRKLRGLWITGLAGTPRRIDWRLRAGRGLSLSPPWLGSGRAGRSFLPHSPVLSGGAFLYRSR